MKLSVYAKVMRNMNQKFQQKCRRLWSLRLSKRNMKKLLVILLHLLVMSVVFHYHVHGHEAICLC